MPASSVVSQLGRGPLLEASEPGAFHLPMTSHEALQTFTAHVHWRKHGLRLGYPNQFRLPGRNAFMLAYTGMQCINADLGFWT